MNYKYQNLTDTSLFSETKKASLKEKAATVELLEYLAEIQSRRAYATKAYSSLFEYIVKELNYSESQAADRVNAVKLIKDVPESKKLLITGELSLTNVSQVERFVKLEKKVGSNKLITKNELVNIAVYKTKRELEVVLLSMHSPKALQLTKEKITPKTEEISEIKFAVSKETLNNLNELKNLIGDESLETIFKKALKELLEKEKKKRGIIQKNKPSAKAILATKSRFIPIEFKRIIYARSNGQCEFIEKHTLQKCQSKFRLQIDHIVPLALNGKTEINNLRHLCQAHNLKAAEEIGLTRILARPDE